MRAAIGGDVGSYRRLLKEIAPALRALVKEGFARRKLGSEDVEDVVQETLLALHLKRGTWDESQAFSPWVYAIARNKLIDRLRRSGRGIHLPIDDIGELRAVHQQAARQVGERLGMTEGAVRVALHGALQGLAKAYRKGSP